MFFSFGEIIHLVIVRNMTMHFEEWRPIDYLTFVMLYIAEADNFIAPEEMELMVAKLGVDRVIGMRKMAADMPKKEQRMWIKKLRNKYYPGQFGKQTILENIAELTNADGIVNDEEHAAMADLKALL